MLSNFGLRPGPRGMPESPVRLEYDLSQQSSLTLFDDIHSTFCGDLQRD